jgi:hypothetical protein
MKKFIIPALALLPAFAYAQSLTGLRNLLDSIGDLVRMALPIVVGLALLGFFWGLAKFIFAQGNEDKSDDGKRMMIWGVVAFFVMVSVWGLVNFVGRSLDIDQESTPGEIPTVPGL